MAENIHYLNDDNFKEAIAEGITLVDFYADWCGPCKRIAPVIEQLAREVEGKVKVAKVDIDVAQKIAAEYEIMSIPTLAVFENGVELKEKRIVGAADLAQLKKTLNL